MDKVITVLGEIITGEILWNIRELKKQYDRHIKLVHNNKRQIGNCFLSSEIIDIIKK